MFNNTRYENLKEICIVLGFDTVLLDSFLPMFWKTVGDEILTAVLVKIQVISGVLPFRLVNLSSPSGPTVQDEGTTFH
jgi:hypothetical protein